MKKRPRRRGAGARPLFEAQHGSAYCAAKRLCVECGGPLPGKRKDRRWCGRTCVDAYKMRADPGFARDRVYDRDGGVCASCGLDTEAGPEVARKKAEHEARRLWWARHKIDPDASCKVIPTTHFRDFEANLRDLATAALKVWRLESWWKRTTFWDADHIKAVADGGPNVLANLRTLCLACHRDRSAAQARARARRAKRLARLPAEACSTPGTCNLRYDLQCPPCGAYKTRAMEAR